MSAVLVLDVGATRLRTSLVRSDDPLSLISASDCLLPTGPDDLDPLLAETVDCVVHRFPHGPEGAPEVVDQVHEAAIAAAGAFEPDDTAARLAVWRWARRQWPGKRHLAVFDDAWFAELPAPARTYAVPPAFAAEWRLRRRGLHGPLHRRAAAAVGRSRVVSVYLDREASAAAVVDGRPVECSAGATGLEGLPGGGTVGDIDPAAILYLVDDLGLPLPEVEAMLRVQGGLAGLSGGRDSAVVCRHDGDERGRAALAFIAHRVRRYVGAFAAVMGGLDALVISHSPCFADPPLFRDIGEGLRYLGIDAPRISGEDLATACCAAAMGR